MYLKFMQYIILMLIVEIIVKCDYLLLAMLGIYVLFIWFQLMDQVKKSTSKGKRSSYSSPRLKQGKLFKPLELTSSSTDGKREENDLLSTKQVPSSNLNLPTKIRSRWKMHKQKPLTKKDAKTSENFLDDQPNLPALSFHNREPNPKV